jgi:hypothetical protein
MIGEGQAQAMTIEQQIAAIFATAGGAWYDPSDPSARFQDNVGTTPTTAVGQIVGLTLDKRLGLARGLELVSNGRFESDAAGWTAGNSASLSATGGCLRIAYGGTTNPFGYAQLPTIIGAWYQFSATVAGTNSAAQTAIRVGTSVGGGQNFASPATGAREVFSIFQATATTSYVSLLYLTSAPGDYSEFDNISIRELPGNHARQATLTARPIFQTSPDRFVFDGFDDTHVTTFPAALGNNCTVVRSVPGIGAAITTGQTIGTTYTQTLTHSGLLIFDRPLTASETAAVTRWGNLRAGV